MFRMKNKSLHEGEKGKVLKYWGTYSVLFMALGAMTFFGVCTPGGQQGAVSGSAAVVAGETITMSEFRRAYKQQTERLRNQYQDAYDPATLKPAANTLKQLVNQRILYLASLDLGIKASDDEVVKYLISVNAFQDEAGKFSQEYFKNFLRYNSYSEASFMEEMQRNLTVQKLRNLVTSASFASSKAAEFDYRIAETKLDLEYLKFAAANVKVTVSAAEATKFAKEEANKKKIDEWYTSHKSDFSKPERVKARHILVSFKGARNASGKGVARTKEAAKKRAETLLTQVKSAGSDFVAIAKKETDEPSGQKSGGDLGFFTREAMVKPFSDAAFKLAKGQLSAVVESPFGFHIIKVEDKEKAQDKTLAEATTEIAKTLIRKEKAPKLLETRATEVFTALKAGQKPTAKMAEYKVAWTKTGEFGANSSNVPGLGQIDKVQEKVLALTKAAPLLPEIVELSGAKYIVRLVTRKDPDMKALDKKKLEQLTGSLSFSSGYQFFSNLEKSEQAKFEKKNEIKMNPDFLALDVSADSSAE